MPELNKKLPMRRCIACGVSKPQTELQRFTFDGELLKADENIRTEGRGCYICKSSECIEKALKKNAFARSFRTKISGKAIETIGRYLNAK